MQPASLRVFRPRQGHTNLRGFNPRQRFASGLQGAGKKGAHVYTSLKLVNLITNLNKVPRPHKKCKMWKIKASIFFVLCGYMIFFLFIIRDMLDFLLLVFFFFLLFVYCAFLHIKTMHLAQPIRDYRLTNMQSGLW